MKSKLLLLLLSVTLLASAKTVTIKGKINGKLPENLYYTAPVNGALGFDLYYTAVPDAQGNFEIRVDIGKVSFIDIFYDYKPAGFLVVTPGENYGITITESEGKITHTISGKDAEAQRLYNTLLHSHRMDIVGEMGQEAVNIKTARELEAYFEKKHEDAVVGFSALLDKKVISQDIFDALATDTKYFYQTVMSYAILLKHIFSDREATPPDLTEFNIAWKKIYQKLNPDAATVTQSPWGWYFLDGYKNLKNFEAAGFNYKKVETSVNQFEGLKQNVALMPLLNAEYYYAASIYNNAFGSYKQKDVIAEFDHFKQQYPKSGYIKYLELKVAPVVAFFTSNSTLPPNAAYIHDYAGINTLNELIKKFPGKKLYFDVWATWCGSCRDEFKYKDELYKLLKANDIMVIYVSVDDDKRDETWKKMISHYKLEGQHIRANKMLDKNLRLTFSGKGGISLPWYFLVDSKGEIAVKYAAPPSDMAKFEADIQKIKD